MTMSRRELLRAAASGAACGAVAGAISDASAGAIADASVSAWTMPSDAQASRVRTDAGTFRGSFILFSKHLPDLAWGDLGRAVRTAGFDGVDLTVRPKGHVLPERVAEDLPRAVDALRAAEASTPMITTAIASVDDPAARPTFAAAQAAGVRLVKPDYYRYQFATAASASLADAPHERAEAGKRFAALAALAAEHGVTLGYHNHTGYMGGPTLDFLPEIERLPAARAGHYFDIRHAVVEGGGIGWKVALAAALPRMRMISVKDVRWARDEKSGRWRDQHVPMGEGMVDWPAFCGALAQASWHGPVSVHLEFPIAGATPDERRARTLDAAARELTFITRHFAEAYRA